MKVFTILNIIVFILWSCKSDQTIIEDDSLHTKVIVIDGVHGNRGFIQKEFVLSTFNGVPDIQYVKPAITNLKQAYFNYIETAWKKREVTQAILTECDIQGDIKVIAQEMSLVGGFVSSIVTPYSKDSVIKFLDLFGSYNSLAGVYIYDEPTIEQFTICKDNIDLFQYYRADLLGFVVALQSYSPWYKWDDDKFVSYDNYIDKYYDEITPAVLSFDYYPMYNETTSESFTKDYYWRDMSCIRKKSIEKQVPFWFYYQSVARDEDGNFNEMKQGYMTAAHIRIQAWSAILYGAKGLQSFSSVNSVINSFGQKGTFFTDVQNMNKEISSLGNTLLALTSTGIYHGATTLKDPLSNSIEESPFIASLPQWLSAGEFSDGKGNNYILLLNRNLDLPEKGTLLLKNKFRIYYCDKYNNGKQIIQEDKASILEYELNPGDAQLFRIESCENKPVFIEYVVN